MTQMANERVSLHVDCEQQADIILFKIRHDFESTFHFFLSNLVVCFSEEGAGVRLLFSLTVERRSCGILWKY